MELILQHLKTFSIGFHEPKFNEAQHSLAIARHLQTDHSDLYVTAKDTLDVIPQLPSIYDEPFGDPSQIPTFIIAQLARRDVTVVLSGDGGDELFGGYNHYHTCVKKWEFWRRFPLSVRRSLSGLVTTLGKKSWKLFSGNHNGMATQLLELDRFTGKLERQARLIASSSPLEILARKKSKCSEISEFVLEAKPVPTILRDQNLWADVSDPVQALMHLDYAEFLTDDVLVKVDRASMASGLEVRCPFLDYRVTEFAWRLPVSMRVQGQQKKRVLRKLLERYVPRDLTERPKQGFGIPVDEWLRTSLRDWAEDLLDDKKIKEQGFLNPEAIHRIWQQHLTGWRNHGHFLWSVLIFQAWYHEYSVHKSGVSI